METFLSLDSVPLCVPAIPSRNAPGEDDQEGEFYCVVTYRRCGRCPLRHRPCLAQTPQKEVAPAAAIQVDIAACSVSQCEAPIRRNEGTSLTFAAVFAAGDFIGGSRGYISRYGQELVLEELRIIHAFHVHAVPAALYAYKSPAANAMEAALRHREEPLGNEGWRRARRLSMTGIDIDR